MALARRCLDCGQLTRASRCPTCQQQRNAARNARRTHLHGDYPARRRALRAAAEAADAACWICGKPIDYAARWPDPASFTADHVVPGDPDSDLMPAHARCNASRGDARR